MSEEFRPYHKNPRKISKKQRDKLRENMETLGDISGIVHNLNTGEIIGGNQRSRIIDIEKADIEVLQEYDEPDQQGTVKIGWVTWNKTRWNYRAVRWTNEQAERANITANSLGAIGIGT